MKRLILAAMLTLICAGQSHAGWEVFDSNGVYIGPINNGGRVDAALNGDSERFILYIDSDTQPYDTSTLFYTQLNCAGVGSFGYSWLQDPSYYEGTYYDQIPGPTISALSFRNIDGSCSQINDCCGGGSQEIDTVTLVAYSPQPTWVEPFQKLFVHVEFPIMVAAGSVVGTLLMVGLAWSGLRRIRRS